MVQKEASHLTPEGYYEHIQTSSVQIGQEPFEKRELLLSPTLESRSENKDSAHLHKVHQEEQECDASTLIITSDCYLEGNEEATYQGCNPPA